MFSHAPKEEGLETKEIFEENLYVYGGAFSASSHAPEEGGLET